MKLFSIKLLSALVLVCNQHLIHASAATTNMPVVNRETKDVLPADLQAEAQEKKLSILKPTDENQAILYQNYPHGALLFPKNPDIASKFNEMINALKKDSDLIEFFRKIHISSLNQLYAYLMKIYINFNLTNPGVTVGTDNPTTNISEYLTHDATYATNKKKLIMNHFINIIQAQFQASIISYAPLTQPDMAVMLGKIFIQNDYGIDLTAFSKQQTDAAIIANQATQINFLQQYISFFQTYTNYLSKLDTNGSNQYYSIAQDIHKFLYPQETPASTASSTANNSATPTTPTPDPALTKTNPTMFFYDVETLRAIQFIPFVANSIPANSQLIPWAPTIIDAAVKNKSVNGHAVAFFTDSAGKPTPIQTQAKNLFFLTEMGPVLFQQELLAQPAWMNTLDGCVRILRACLGDFSALVGLGILDSTLETIIQKATNLTAKK